MGNNIGHGWFGFGKMLVREYPISKSGSSHVLCVVSSLDYSAGVQFSEMP
jgi:hypothetical protein